MSLSDLIYLDHAATSFPKSATVKDAIFYALTEAAGNPGRSAHALAVRAAESVYEVRETLAQFFDASSPERVVFTSGATAALNMAIFCAAAKGGHFLCSDIEHNATLRPLEHLRREGKISYDVFPSDSVSETMLSHYVKKNTVALVATHASNVCGRVLPIRAIGDFCRKRNILFILDAAQSAGHIPISVRKERVDILCAPAHKGLFGVLGAGFAIFETERLLPPFLLGGSGSFSHDPTMPDTLPERYEAGSLPVPAILALGAAINELPAPLDAEAHLLELSAYLFEKLSALGGVRLTDALPPKNGVFSFTHDRLAPSEIAEALSDAGVFVRAGFHCAPLAHKTLGTHECGTVRASLGITSTKKDCDEFVERIFRILK